MTLPPQPPQPPRPPTPPPPSSSFPRTRHWGAAFGGGVKASVNWWTGMLANISWGRFFLLAFIAMILGGILTSIVETLESNFRRGDGGGHHAVRFDVKIDPEGVKVAPSDNKEGAVEITPDRVEVQKPGKGSVSIEGNEIRIESKKAGKEATIRIGKDGVHIDRGAAAPPSPPAAEAPPASADAPTPPAPPEAPKAPVTIGGVEVPAGANPDEIREKVREVVDQVRSEFEDAANDQIDAEVRRRLRSRGASPSEVVMPLVMLVLLFLTIVKILAGGKRKAEVQAQAATERAEGESLKRQLVEARMQTMQAQVEPHFLFNTLASVDYLIETDPKRASTMQKNLIQYLRASLPRMREQQTNLGREVDLIRAYLEILHVRMEDRLRIAISVPQGLRSAEFPPMMLQSLVENAIKHGLEPKPEGGELHVQAEVVDGKLHVVVADTGLGWAPNGGATAGTGLGLANIRERLALLYGQQAQLVVAANVPAGTIVTIELPYRTAGRGSQEPQ